MHPSKPSPDHPAYRTRPPHDVFPEDIDCVLDPSPAHAAIYIGNLEAAENLHTLRKLNISSLLTACKNIHIRHPKQHVAYSLYIPGEDHQNYDLSLHFQTAVNFIHQSLKQTNILVHCMAGISRSVTLVIAYLIKHKNMSFEQALKSVQNRRRKINPNPGFIRQLQAYEQKISRARYNPQSQQLRPFSHTSASFVQKNSKKCSNNQYSREYQAFSQNNASFVQKNSKKYLNEQNSQEYQAFSQNNASFVQKNIKKYLNNQNLSYEGSNYKAAKPSDAVKLKQKYQSYSKTIANSRLQYSNGKAYNPEKEQYYRPRTNYQNKQDRSSSFFKQSYFHNPSKMVQEQRVPSTLSQITNHSSYNSQLSSNIQNLSRDLDDRIAKIKQKYYEGREVNLNRSLIQSEDQRAKKQIHLQNSGVARQSFNRQVFNSTKGFRTLARQYI